MMKQKSVILATVLFFSLGMMGCGGDTTTSGSCPADTPATCGNGMLEEASEQCDPGGAGVPANFGTKTCGSVIANTTGPLQCGCCMLNTDLCISGSVTTAGTGG